MCYGCASLELLAERESSSILYGFYTGLNGSDPIFDSPRLILSSTKERNLARNRLYPKRMNPHHYHCWLADTSIKEGDLPVLASTFR